MLGIIGGSGIYSLKRNAKNIAVRTPYGNAAVRKARIFDKDVVFIQRHGTGHSIPPHKVNYRANIYALKKLGVNSVLGIYACGIISKYKPGDIIVPDDFLGFWTPATFFDDFKGGIKHVDFSEPYDKDLKDLLFAVSRTTGVKVRKGGVIATTVGPRFETKAEIRALKTIGADLVSMTHGYEAALIGELELPYVSLAVGTNYACGVSKEKLSAEEVIEHMQKAKGRIVMLVNGMIKEIY